MEATDLELTPETMRRMAERCVAEVIDHIARLPQAPRSNLENIVEITRALREKPPVGPADFDALVDHIMEKVIPVSINTVHPTYLAYIPGGGLFVSALADFIAAATNRFVGAWYAAPAAARLETNVTDWFAEWMGYPASACGILTSGGSLANFSAVVTARRELLQGEISRGTMYISNQTHHSVMKAAYLAGISEKNIRVLPVDHRFRAVPEAFEAAIRADQARGFKPFLIVGNAGTTNTGAIDPLPALAEVAARHGAWFHVDAAYGGFFNLCEQGRRRLAGISEADSIVLDPHKGLFVPYGTGSLLVKNGELLRKAHMLRAEYLQDQFTPEGEMNLTEYSPELSRPFRGLRVWLPLKLYGVEAFRENLAEKLRLAAWMYDLFQQTRGFETFSAPDLSVIAFRYRPKSGEINDFNRRLLKTIVDSKRLFLSSTLLNGEFAIRICVLSFRTHQPELEAAWDTIRWAVRTVEAL